MFCGIRHHNLAARCQPIDGTLTDVAPFRFFRQGCLAPPLRPVFQHAGFLRPFGLDLAGSEPAAVGSLKQIDVTDDRHIDARKLDAYVLLGLRACEACLRQDARAAFHDAGDGLAQPITHHIIFVRDAIIIICKSLLLCRPEVLPLANDVLHRIVAGIAQMGAPTDTLRDTIGRRAVQIVENPFCR